MTERMTDEQLIEAMARAICTTWGYEWDGDPADPQTAPETCVDMTPGKFLYREAATAALAAIRAAGCKVVRKGTADMYEKVREAYLKSGGPTDALKDAYAEYRRFELADSPLAGKEG